MITVALTAILTIVSDGTSTPYLTEDRHCDGLLRTLSEQMPADTDMTCIAMSPRPIARPDDLGAFVLAQEGVQ